MNETHAEEIKKVGELIKDIRTAMMTTLDAYGDPRSCPMYSQDHEFDGQVWFMTPADSHQAKDIAINPRVNLSYASTAKESYLSATGSAKILNDRALIKRFWSPFLKAWWESPDDPAIRLIRVDVDRVEYWDTPGGKIASVLSAAKAAITGTRDDSNDHGKVDLTSGRSPNLL